jgi:hypothetical protein
MSESKTLSPAQVDSIIDFGQDQIKTEEKRRAQTAINGTTAI